MYMDFVFAFHILDISLSDDEFSILHFFNDDNIFFVVFFV
jgi:hypothetical protein